jgi:hypothetical protein
MKVLAKRPTGYQESQASKELYKRAVKPYGTAIVIALLFMIIGFFPLLAHVLAPGFDPVFQLGDKVQVEFLGYKQVANGTETYGPFGLGALILSFAVPLGLALAIGYFYRAKTKDIIEIRNQTKKLEEEFASGLFQLGNRIGDGVPSEVAFDQVADTMEGSPTGKFFRLVDTNIRRLGMGLKEAIFNPKTGALLAFPSPLVESSMEVLLESSKKGPKVTANSLLSISTYIDKIHRVDERLRDLLSEISSSMRAQVNFLTPVIAGIVIGVASMVVSIIVNLNTQFAAKMADSATSGDMPGISSGLDAVLDVFNIQGLIPSYFFQLVVGIYLVELAVILTYLQNSIENASDSLMGEYLISKSVIKSTILYTIIGIAVILIFNLLAGSIITSNFGG